ncbi:MAG TPA: hypothetical protein VN457_02850, partial [Chlamydiales bacterium]|nr:hypothetical protein [Chlamydiales bacterium]
MFFMAIGYNDIRVEVPAQVVVEIAKENATVGEPIVGEISVIRTRKQKLDPASFQYDGKPLKVEFIREEVPASQSLFSANDPEGLVVSKYRFTLPPREKGLYLMGVVSVKIAGVEVRSSQRTFEVMGASSSDNLRLTAKIIDSPPFYPGQKITLQYQIFYRRPVELTKEDLALFSIVGLQPIGSPKIEDVPVQEGALQTISQTVIAHDPGTFQSKPSLIEGYIYSEDESGKKTYLPPKLQASSPPLEIVITPFPENGRPDSFTGAIGTFSWKARLKNGTSYEFGEKIEVELQAFGSGDLNTVELPYLKAQKSLVSAFRLPDILPRGTVQESVKRFLLELMPISENVKEIPAIECSSFDPLAKKYYLVKTDPIAIQIRPSNTEGQKREQNTKQKTTGATSKVEALEIDSVVPLSAKNIKGVHLGDKVLIFIAMLFAGLYVLEVIVYAVIKRKIEERRKGVVSSRELFLQALKIRSEPQKCLQMIKEAQLKRLQEIGETKTLVQFPEDLLDTGLQGDIKRFLLSIEKKRFSGLGVDAEVKELVEEASRLFHILKGVQRGNG